MRLIGSLKNQQESFIFQKFCRHQKIDILLDKSSQQGQEFIQVWVVNEDDTSKAEDLLERFKKDPSSPEFYVLDEPVLNETDYDTSQPHVIQKKPKLPLFTWLWIFVSVICFFIQMSQEVALVKNKGSIMMEFGLTSIEQELFFDIPQGFEELEEFAQNHNLKTLQDLNSLPDKEKAQFETLKNTAYFHGFLDMLEDHEYKQKFESGAFPLFHKIKQGQLYRLVTPALLHGSLLHILFNMIWLFILLKQVEIKIGIFRSLILVLICAIASNIAQYLVSGPFFVGASGIIIGLATFIWARQKKAPWEGYLLSKGLIFFLMIYVLALVALSIGVFVFNLSSSKNIAFGIANTAHVVGGACGYLLGSLSFFRRR
jgi:GlpG protein